MAIPEFTSRANFDQRDGLALGVLVLVIKLAVLLAATKEVVKPPIPLETLFFLPFTRGFESCTIIFFNAVPALANLRTDKSKGGKGRSGSI